MRRPLISALALLVAGAGLLTGVAEARDTNSLTLKSAASDQVSKSKSVVRVHLIDGKRKVVERRTVSVSVDLPGGLRDRQAVRVSWRGAHPTGGLVADQNSGSAATQQEYPVVLMQCRGVDGPSVRPSQRIRPETCWTQTPFERFSNSYGTELPPWRLDQFAPQAERARYVGQPKPRPQACFGAADAERWVPFEAPGGKRYRGGPNGCAGMAPEATSVGSLNLPSNTTYAATGTNGRGSAIFNVRAATSNASLGCSDRVACSLVVIPVVGISCDVDGKSLPGKTPDPGELSAAADRCTAKGKYEAGQNSLPNLSADAAVSGSLWWSASNWRNRISFPLDFASSSATCDITGSGGEALFGSELMIQAFDQWSPVFCLDPARTPMKQVQTGEPQARNLFATGAINAALVSRLPEGQSFSRPTVKAPVAATGFAVTFTVDDENGRPLRQLKMSPRLLAKLLTLSYPAINAVKTSYPALSQNPLNITADPEFQALNPDVPEGVGTQSAATLLSLSSDSDVIWALTSYIDADPEARAWLDGKPDPWGMRVNPNYKGIELPTETWRSLDDFKPEAIYKPGVNDCLHQNPVPYLPLVAAPLTRLSYISLAMQFSIAQSQVVCSLPSLIPGSTEGAKMVALGRQTPGFRFMLGVSSIADAQRYELSAASLQTRVESGASAELSSLRGRTFVPPTPTSLQSAVGEMTPDTSSDMWAYDYRSSLRTAPDAYPGTLLVYATLPTSGLEKPIATAYADWLRYVVTDGQQPGDDLGELPAGYVPLTAANGLEGLKEYSLRAADAVAAQRGDVPQIGEDDSPEQVDPGGADVPSGGSPIAGAPLGGGVGGGLAPGGKPPTETSETDQTVPLGETQNFAAGLAGLAVPIGLGVALLVGVMSAAVLIRDRRRARRSM